MKRVKLIKNSDGRFETFYNDEHYSTLTCGNRFHLLCCDCVKKIPGRIEYNRYGYYWVSDDQLEVEYLRNGIIGFVK